jgi:hypothetical protein
MFLLISSLRTYARGYPYIYSAMSSTSVSLRDVKKALRKSIKERLAQIPMGVVVDQCAKPLRLLFHGRRR